MFHLLDVLLRNSSLQPAPLPVKANTRLAKTGRKCSQCAHPVSAHAKVWERLRGEAQPTRPAGEQQASQWSRRSRPQDE